MHISHLSLDLHQPSLLSSLSSLSHGRKLMLETGFLFTFFAIASSPVQEFDNNSPHFFTRICNGKLKIKTTYNIYIFRFRIFLFKKSQEMSRENEENEWLGEVDVDQTATEETARPSDGEEHRIQLPETGTRRWNWRNKEVGELKKPRSQRAGRTTRWRSPARWRTTTNCSKAAHSLLPPWRPGWIRPYPCRSCRSGVGGRIWRPQGERVEVEKERGDWKRVWRLRVRPDRGAE